jgi:hypothetical protein
LRAQTAEAELAAARGRLEAVKLIAVELVQLIAACPKGSIGSFENVYICQIDVHTIDVLKEHIDEQAIKKVGEDSK